MNPKKTIIVITSSFPFGTGEIFFATELKYLETVFAKVIIFSNDDESRNPEKLDVKLEAYKFDFNLNRQTLAVFFSLEFWKDMLAYLFGKESMKSFKGIKHLFIMYLRAYAKSAQIKKLLLEQNLLHKDDLSIYAYWMTDDAIAAALLRKNKYLFHAYTRAHGYDVYETRNEFNFLPGRKIIKNNLDKMFFISESGMQHFINQHGAPNKCVLAPLGVEEQSYKNEELSNVLHIVSCSYIHTVKRIELLIDALMAVDKGINIHWTHIGGGLNQKFWEDALNYSKQLMSHHNIQFKMLGSKSNNEILDFYKNTKVDVLINVSASEGIPVAMMEAISFGIPIIALNVGGIPEIVKDGFNGLLTHENATAKDIALKIESFINLNQAEINKMRQNAYETWKNKFNAKQNYTSFVNKLIS